MVERVEELRSELHTESFRHSDVLNSRNVPIVETWASADSAARIPEVADCIDKGSGVDVLRHCFRSAATTGPVRPWSDYTGVDADASRVNTRRSRRPVGRIKWIRELKDRRREAALKRRDARDFPAA